MEKPEPFAAILSCADSRVPVEVVFDQTIGQLFVTRVAGNMVTAEIMASLEYAVAVLGTHTILVMGHSRCGAVTAAIQATHHGQVVPGQISALFPHIDLPVRTFSCAWFDERDGFEFQPLLGVSLQTEKAR